MLRSMHEQSAREVERAAEIAGSLGVEHQVVCINWEEDVEKKDSLARYRRFPTLVHQCRKLGVGVLMTAHNMDDQIGMYAARGGWTRFILTSFGRHKAHIAVRTQTLASYKASL